MFSLTGDVNGRESNFLLLYACLRKTAKVPPRVDFGVTDNLSQVHNLKVLRIDYTIYFHVQMVKPQKGLQ